MGAAAELQVYIWMYVDQAMQLRHSPIGNALFTLLSKEWPTAVPSTDTFTARVKRKPSRHGAGIDYGYDAYANALWFRRDWPTPPAASALKERTITPAQLRNLFDTNREIHRGLGKYLDDRNGFIALHERRVQPIIGDRTIELLKILHADESSIAFCRGAVVVGASNPLVWIGLTHDMGLAHDPDGGRRAVSIQRRVVDMPALRSAPTWIGCVPSCTSSHIALTELVYDIVQELFPGAREVETDGLRYAVVETFSFEDLSGPALFWYAPPSGVKRDDLCKLIAILSSSGFAPEWIFIVNATVTTDDLVHALPDLTSPIGRLVLLDGRTVLGWIGERPWLWSRYQRDCAFRICRVADAAELQDALLATTLREQIPVTDEVTRDIPAFEQPHVRITGRPGSGKSTAAYHLMRHRYADAVAVLLAPHIQADDLTVITALAHDAPRIGIARIVIVLDDLQRHHADILRVLQRTLAQPWVSMVVTSESTEEDRIQERFGAWTPAWTAWNLDAADPDFIRRLIEYCAQYVSLPLPLSNSVQSFATRASTPRGIITALTRQHALGVTEDAFWQQEYDALARDRAHEERRVLLGLAFLRRNGIPTTRSTLALLLPNTDVDDGLATLAAKGWLTVRTGRIGVDDVQLAPALRDLLPDGTPSAEHRSLVHRVLDAMPPALQYLMLEHTLGIFVSTDHETDRRVLTTLLTFLPDNDLLVAVAAEHLIAYDPDAGDAAMRRYLRARPNAWNWREDWVNAHTRRRNGAARTVAVLEEALRAVRMEDEMDARELLDLPASFAAIFSYRRLIAEMLERIADTPAATLLARRS